LDVLVGGAGSTEFAELPRSQRYAAANAAAKAWFDHFGRGGATAPISVKQACAMYVSHVRATRGDAPANDMKKRFERWIDADDTLGKIDLSKLARARVEKWRAAMAGTPVKVNRDNRATPVTRARSEGSVSRDISAVRAALNHAHDLDHTTPDMAWRVALRPAKNADGRREVYLDIRQRRSLINNAATTPLRTSPHSSTDWHWCHCALARWPPSQRKVLANDWGVLLVGRGKAGRDRWIKLPPATAQSFSTRAKGKTPDAPLLSRADGKAWDKDAWKWPIEDAAQAANLPVDTTCYAMRHSVITDLVTGGLDLLTVALPSGTSVAMIERHYGRLRAEHAAAALAKPT
jgi:site-specific recombinase XerD